MRDEPALETGGKGGCSAIRFVNPVPAEDKGKSGLEDINGNNDMGCFLYHHCFSHFQSVFNSAPKSVLF